MPSSFPKVTQKIRQSQAETKISASLVQCPGHYICCLSDLAWHLDKASPSMCARAWPRGEQPGSPRPTSSLLGEATMVLLVLWKQGDLQVLPLARDGFGHHRDRNSTAT